MSNKPRFGFVVEYVKDVEAAKRFYVDDFGIAGDRPIAGGGEPELYWLVDDAEAAFSDLSEKAEVSLPLEQKPFGTVFGIKDTDGRPRYLLELSKDRPSQPAQ